MLDLHKLKLKYRELSSQYAENLMQPVFKTSKRSYTHFPDELKYSSNEIRVQNIIDSRDQAYSSEIVSPQNEFLGETASRLKVEIQADPVSMTPQAHGETLKGQRQSNLTNKNETFHSSVQNLDHKFMPQYHKKVTTRNNGATLAGPGTHNLNKNSGSYLPGQNQMSYPTIAKN